MQPSLQSRIPQTTTLTAVAVGIVLTVAIGVLTGQGDFRIAPALIALGVATVILFKMGSQAWLLLPLCWPLTGKIQALPLPYSVRDLAVFAAVGVTLSYIIIKKVRIAPRLDAMALLVWANLFYLLTVYLRNPVGVRALGSEMVGGKPYFDTAMAVAAFLILASMHLKSNQAILLPILMLAGNLVVSFIGVMTHLVPGLVPYVSPLYSGVTTTTYIDEQLGRQARGGLGESRVIAFQGFGVSAVLASVAIWNPITLLNPVNLVRFSLFAAGMLSIGFSGFRNAIAIAMGIVIIGSYLHGGLITLIRMSVIALAGYILMASIQYSEIVRLPNTFQRVVSWLPGPWDQRIREGGTQSTEWRIEMWKIMLTDEKYLKNRWFGDGFGMTRDSMRRMMHIQTELGLSADQRQFESYLISGTVHSGPVGTIRFTGVVGLVFFLALSFYKAKYSYDNLRMARGSPFHIAAMLSAISDILSPFYFIFIFGDLNQDLPNAIYGAGIAMMIRNCIETWKKEQRGLPQPPEPGPAKDFRPSLIRAPRPKPGL